MTNTIPAIEVRKARRGWAVCAGVSILGRGFKTREQAEAWAQENDRFLAYWAGSIGVSVENTPARIINA